MADDNMTRTQVLAFISAHEAASKLVAHILEGMKEASEVIRAFVASDTSENLDPYSAKIVRNFAADMQLLEVFLSLRDLSGGDVSETASPRDVLMSLGMHCDWLPEASEQPAIADAIKKYGGKI